MISGKRMMKRNESGKLQISTLYRSLLARMRMAELSKIGAGGGE
jgi:hypothetical protein